MGIVEKTMETPIVSWGHMGIVETTIVHWGCMGIVEKKLKTTTVSRGYIWVLVEQHFTCLCIPEPNID